MRNTSKFSFLSHFFFFFNDTATTEIYTLSLHDALPISGNECVEWCGHVHGDGFSIAGDRKSTRLNSSHGYISYAVFCLKKKKNTYQTTHHKLKTITKKKNLPLKSGG